MPYKFRTRKENELQCDYCKGCFDVKLNKDYCECSGQLRSDKTDQVLEDNGFIYCNKLCARKHYKQLVKEGKISESHVEIGHVVLKDKQYTDLSGDPVWFPSDGRPYFDQGLRRTFNSIQEKTNYLRENRIVSDGSLPMSKNKLAELHVETSRRMYEDVKRDRPDKIERIQRRKHG